MRIESDWIGAIYKAIKRSLRSPILAAQPWVAVTGHPTPAKVTTGSLRARSLCEEQREEIKHKLETGLSAIRIHQGLVDERCFQ